MGGVAFDEGFGLAEELCSPPLPGRISSRDWLTQFSRKSMAIFKKSVKQTNKEKLFFFRTLPKRETQISRVVLAQPLMTFRSSKDFEGSCGFIRTS